MKILSADPNRFKRHLKTVHAECVGKTLEFFRRKLNEFIKYRHLPK
jgi:hypothetical protein